MASRSLLPQLKTKLEKPKARLGRTTPIYCGPRRTRPRLENQPGTFLPCITTKKPGTQSQAQPSWEERETLDVIAYRQRVLAVSTHDSQRSMKTIQNELVNLFWYLFIETFSCTYILTTHTGLDQTHRVFCRKGQILCDQPSQFDVEVVSLPCPIIISLSSTFKL